MSKTRCLVGCAIACTTSTKGARGPLCDVTNACVKSYKTSVRASRKVAWGRAFTFENIYAPLEH